MNVVRNVAQANALFISAAFASKCVADQLSGDTDHDKIRADLAETRHVAELAIKELDAAIDTLSEKDD